MKTYYKPDLTNSEVLKTENIFSFNTKMKNDYLQITEFSFKILLLFLKYKIKGHKIFLVITPIGDDFAEQNVKFFTLKK